MKMTFVACFGDLEEEEWGSSFARTCFDPWILIRIAFWYYFVQFMLKIPLQIAVWYSSSREVAESRYGSDFDDTRTDEITNFP